MRRKMYLYPGANHQCLNQGQGFGKGPERDGFETFCRGGKIHRTLWPTRISLREELRMVSMWEGQLCQALRGWPEGGALSEWGE